MKNYITIALLCLLNIAFSQDSAELKEKEMNAEIAFGKFTDCLWRIWCLTDKVVLLST